ncbi:uncharacterized protein FIBRA_03530 [Fibroporia radiculosa]|uniref:Uncharacterized protein n=1 Tax=Fibroporia radiculosa TaxID=599839 RepID=J4I9N6_9APHY|nr:uncharacterized protein FIBRA_03530 [Fibroporia radiculosa]CCM01476.1 predicted protein [Fibroporia radiculosa]
MPPRLAVVHNNRPDVERVMPAYQRGLVDNCFEEGQYEAGIMVLDQLRSARYRPWGPHVRQLVYIALYPPQSHSEARGLGNVRFEPGSLGNLLSEQRLYPSPSDTQAALNLLTAFSVTNTPAAIFCALPHYPAPSGDTATCTTVDMGEEDEDSEISRQSLRIRNAKDCWTILKETFVQRIVEKPPSPKRKGRSRKRAAREDTASPAQEDNADHSLNPISQYAWPILDWIIDLLERDEVAIERSGQPRHSPLLLTQIPPPRTTTGGRWDVEVILEIIMCAFQQTDAKRRSLGIRLLALLINLTSTTLVDLPMILNAVSNHISSLPSDGIAALLAALPPSRAVLQFKLALYKSLITAHVGNLDSTGTDSRSQGRLQPRPVRRGQSSLYNQDSSIPKPATELNSVSITRKYAVMSPSEALSLIKDSGSPGLPRPELASQIKVELALTYWMLRRQIAQEDPNVEWDERVQTEALYSCASIAAKTDGDLTARDLDQLGNMLST